MHKKISILGSTGSIGTSALQVIRHLGEGYEVVALAAHSNIDLLHAQIEEFKPKLAVVFDLKAAERLKERLPHQWILSGEEGLKVAATFEEANFILASLTGSAGLVPTLEALKSGKKVALANKEALVSGGELVMRVQRETGTDLIPVDSEHSALFQCLQGNQLRAVHRLILTASGGPFRAFSYEELANITVSQALKHPNWKMGPKVTIDSSTLMNKGLEVIEAHWLFGLPLEKIEVVIHPQSIIHSMVEYCDGALMAQMGEPSMLLPIQYALTYPERRPGLLKPFDFIYHERLEFKIPDLQKFRCLALAYEALKEGASMPCYMNAANEVLVGRFIKQEITWQAIGQKLESLMERHTLQQVPSIESILEIDRQARLEAQEI